MELDDAALSVMRRLRDAGHLAWQVGGCVRDRLLGLALKDIDIATDATPARLAELFGGVKLVGASFGVCIVPVGEHRFEVATFRRDGRYVDKRRPESVEYGTMEDDAQRRDFTVNALYFDPLNGEVRDLVGGREDLAAGVIRTVGEPERRFDEDALRLLRAVRFAARLDFRIEDATRAAIARLAPTIRAVSPERHREELTLMLTGPHPGRAFRLMDELGLLAELLPEVSALHGVEQGRRFHPEGDVFVHTMLCLDNLAPEDRTPVAGWAMLLHDIGKAATFERREDGRITFYQHEHVGADMAGRVCERFRFSADDARRICDVVRRHMKFVGAREWSRSTMRRFVAADTLREDLAIHRADALSSVKDLSAWEFVRDAAEALRGEAERPTLPPPLLTGADLIALGYRPGPKFREILEAVQEEQLEGRLADGDAARVWVIHNFPPAIR